MRASIKALGLSLILGMYSPAVQAQAPNVGGGAPTGICQVWNGKTYDSQPCVRETGGGGEGDDNSNVDKAHSLDRSGVRLYNQGNFEEAYNSFEQARRIYPQDGSAYYGMCLVKSRWNLFAEALGYCQAALNLGTKDVWSTSKNNLRARISDLKVKEEAQRVEGWKEVHAESFNKCKTYYQEMDWDRALYNLNYYTDGTFQGRPNLQEAFTLKGEVLVRLGRFEEAEQSFYQAYKINPVKALQDVEAGRHPNLADGLWDLNATRALFVTGKDIDSKLLKVSLLQESLRFRPGDYKSLYWLGYSEADVYRYGEALEHFRQAEIGFKQNCALDCEEGSLVQPTYIDRHPVPGSTRVGKSSGVPFIGKSPAWTPPNVSESSIIIFNTIRDANCRLELADELESIGLNDESRLKDRAESRADAYLYKSEHKKAYAIIQGLLSKFPDHPEYKHFSQILPRIIVHDSMYIMEAKRQAEQVERNGLDGVLYEIDQNMKCVAGQTFDGVGSCINNGFSWP